MPGLTIETNARRSGTAAVPAPAIALVHGSGSASNSHSPSADGSRAASSRASSPTRPPISPITPTLAPARLASVAASAAAPVPAPPSHQAATTSTTTPSPRTTLPPKNPNNVTTTTSTAVPDFALGRPAFTLTSQLDQSQTAIPPPLPQAIDFDENPDVLAVRSAITILQLQRARAAADIQALQRAKNAALQDPETFVADLAEGRVGTEGDPLMFPHAGGSDDDDSDDDDEDEDEEDEDSNDEDEHGGQTDNGDADMLSNEGGAQQQQHQQGSSSIPNPQHKKRKNPAWRKLPKPQTVVRCPPINWSQYAVVGESLDKLHAEQVAAPTPGAPLVLGPGGTYEFNSNNLGQQESERPRKLVGIAAPYVPGRDRIDNNKKGKGGRR